MANKHFYEQSVASWNREWVDDNSDDSDMTDEEEMDFRAEMAAVNAEAAAYRRQEREEGAFISFPEPIFEGDMPF